MATPDSARVQTQLLGPPESERQAAAVLQQQIWEVCIQAPTLPVVRYLSANVPTAKILLGRWLSEGAREASRALWDDEHIRMRFCDVADHAVGCEFDGSWKAGPNSKVLERFHQ